MSYQPFSEPYAQEKTLTTVVHVAEPGDVSSTEVQPLTNDLIEVWYGGGDCGDAVVLVKRQRPIVHD